MKKSLRRFTGRLPSLLVLCSLAVSASAEAQDFARDPFTNTTDRVFIVDQSPKVELPAVDAIHQAFLTLGCVLICHNHLQRFC